MWPYFLVKSCSCTLIQVFQFASFILSFEPDVRHRNHRKFVKIITKTNLLCVLSADKKLNFAGLGFHNISWLKILQIIWNICPQETGHILLQDSFYYDGCENINIFTFLKKINATSSVMDRSTQTGFLKCHNFEMTYRIGTFNTPAF